MKEPVELTDEEIDAVSRGPWEAYCDRNYVATVGQPTAAALLAARFADGHRCECCFRGADGHVVFWNALYRQHVVRCAAEFEDDPAVVRRHNLRLLLGGLS